MFFEAEARGCTPSGLPWYSDTTLAEADHTARFVAGCYAGFPRFDDFVHYSMFYFAAASYAEMARRVVPERAAAGFLRADDLAFASALRALSPACGVDGLAARVRDAVDAVNIAGLCDSRKKNWYGADAEDTIAGASKLGVAPATVATVLAGLGLSPEP